MRIRNTLTIVILAALLMPLMACGGNEQETEKFPRTDDLAFKRSFSEMVSYDLPNGIAVYLQEDSTMDQVAVEVFYRAGFCHEPPGQPQVSHLAEHVLVISPTENFPVGGGEEKLSRGSRIAAQAIADFVHFDYIVTSDGLEGVLQLTSEQMTSVKFDEDVRAEHAERAAEEITRALGSDRGSLTKFGMIALLHAIQHGTDFVPIYQANMDRTVEEMAAFHEQHYRVDDMVLVVVGNVRIDETRALIDKYLAGIPASPEPPSYKVDIRGDREVKWDIDASVVYLVYPGPFSDPRERAVLTAFGGYLHQYIAQAPEVPSMTKSTYTTNSSYPVKNLPFFVFAQPAQYRTTTDVRDLVSRLVDEALSTLDENMFNRVIGVFKSQVQRSFLEAEADNYEVQNHRVIGQHALNTGIRHYLRDGMTTEEYVAMLDSVTYEEMKEILGRYLSPDQRRVVTISGQ